MERIYSALCAPGRRGAVEFAAQTVVVVDVDGEKNGKSADAAIGNASIGLVKTRLLDRWLDKVVQWSGSEFTFFTIIIALLAWAFLGIPFGQSNYWQVGISDAQAVINMVFDAFLMRQQLNTHDSLMFVVASLRSRIRSNKRMLKDLMGSGQYDKITLVEFGELQQTEFKPELPAEGLVGRISTGASNFLGHIGTVCAYCVGIIIWIAFGQYCGWTNTWQLYINSATSALMVFTLAFLANIRERHSKYMTKCLESINEVDAALELRLRTMTGDRTENPSVVISPPKRSRFQRAIDYYADLVGTLLGIAILFLTMIIWVVIGPALSFDTNWWLIIGTYAGLVGLNDGFVLRNVSNILDGYGNAEFSQLNYDDMEMLSLVGVTEMNEERVADNSLSCRISIKMGNICSHERTVLLGFLTIVGLLIAASALGWSVTGQLICNVPPSIIESFFMIILITGHNVGDAKRRVELYNIYSRRLKLVSYLERAEKSKSEEE